MTPLRTPATLRCLASKVKPDQTVQIRHETIQSGQVILYSAHQGNSNSNSKFIHPPYKRTACCNLAKLLKHVSRLCTSLVPRPRGLGTRLTLHRQEQNQTHMTSMNTYHLACVNVRRVKLPGENTFSHSNSLFSTWKSTGGRLFADSTKSPGGKTLAVGGKPFVNLKPPVRALGGN